MTGGGRRLPLLCVITDRSASGKSPAEAAEEALRAGASWIQYRDKERSRRELHTEALRLREITYGYGALLIVNDHADIALAADADGVHLGQDDLPLAEARRIMGRRIIGISTHSVEEAVEAAAGGADYIGFGPVFGTGTKDAGAPRGVGMLSEVRRHVAVPVVAIGGVTPETLPAVLGGGADAAAVASAIMRGDITKNLTAFLRILKQREGDA